MKIKQIILVIVLVFMGVTLTACSENKESVEQTTYNSRQQLIEQADKYMKIIVPELAKEVTLVEDEQLSFEYFDIVRPGITYNTVVDEIGCVVSYDWMSYEDLLNKENAEFACILETSWYYEAQFNNYQFILVVVKSTTDGYDVDWEGYDEHVSLTSYDQIYYYENK